MAKKTKVYEVELYDTKKKVYYDFYVRANAKDEAIYQFFKKSPAELKKSLYSGRLKINNIYLVKHYHQDYKSN